ncbi:MAG: acyltransferase family protein, partial [Lachnospiraceae bacterium]|nr:acyltransferase family protein [Lachnospiraceae bacterium]
MEGKIDLQRTRAGYIDALKGLAIILVLLGHRSFHTYITQLIYFFHMPLFFFLSGFLDKMQYSSVFEYAQKKAKRLLYPYLVFGVLIIVYHTAFDAVRGATVSGRLTKRVIALLYGNYIWENNSDYIGTLWFLVGLFFAGIFAYGMYRYARKNKLALLIGVMLMMCAGAACSYVNRKYGIRLPWCID